MTLRTRSGIVLLAAVAMAVFASVAAASTSNFGNAAIGRSVVDTYASFTIVDMAATAPSDGVITDLNYYAANTNSFRFVLINSVNKVLWVSGPITPSGLGVATYTLATPLPVHVGDAVGIYSVSTGVIPFDYTNTIPLDPYTPNLAGLPTVGSTLLYEGSTGRDYSYNVDEQTCAFAIGQPINADGSSVFKAKRGVVPVKLTGCDNPDLAPTISIERTSDSPPGTVDEVSSVSAADSGQTMRFDPTAGQYIYNLSTTNLGVGAYTLTITVGGFTVATVQFGLS